MLPALFSLSHFSLAQDTTLARDTGSRLEELAGYSQSYYYSPGQKARAVTIAEMMESAGNFFRQEIGFTPKTKLYILAPQHWKAFAAPPLAEVYGFPHNIDPYRLAIAAEDNAFWQSFLPPVDQLPPDLANRVREAYRETDGTYSMRAFFDLLALHEMGHSYTAQAGLKMHRYWMGELFVNLMLHTYVAEVQPEWLPALETFPAVVLGKGTEGFEFTSLEDFEALYPTLGMGPRNYGWYQARLHAAAGDIYNTGGREVLRKLWKALLLHQEDLDDAAFAEMLKREVHPSVAGVYLRWNEKNGQ